MFAGVLAVSKKTRIYGARKNFLSYKEFRPGWSVAFIPNELASASVRCPHRKFVTERRIHSVWVVISTADKSSGSAPLKKSALNRLKRVASQLASRRPPALTGRLSFL